MPDDVRTEMRTAYGVDVDKVHRGPEASDEARELGARAFARAGEMFVPPEAGRLDTPEGKSIVAHELTHVSQQRRTGGLLPQEDSLAGQALEAEAQEAERFFRGDAGAPRPGSRQKSGDSDVVNGSKSTKSSKSNAATDDSGISEAQAMMGKLVSEGLAVSDGGGGIVFTQPAPRGSSTGVQRQITAAPPVMQSGSPTQTPTNLNPFETLASGVSQDRTGFGHDMLTTGVAVVQGVQAEIALALNETERDLAVREFRDLRLEHRKTQFLTEQEQSTLSSDDEQTLELEVQEEVDRRLLELESRVNMRLDVMNPQRSADQGVPAGQASEEGGAQSPALHPDQYQVVVRRLFGNPESPIPPDDTSDVSTPAVRGLVQRGTTQAGPDQSSPTGEGAGPGSTGGSGTGAMPARVAGRVADQGTGVGWAMRSPRTAAQAPSEIFRPDRGGGVGAATGALPAVAEISSDLARYTAGTSAAETTARAPFPDTTTGPPFAETAISTPVAEAPGRVAEFATAGVQSIGAGAVGQEAVGSSGHEQLDLDHLDLDELSARIYGRLRRRLRAELLIDRERAGLLTDFR